MSFISCDKSKHLLWRLRITQWSMVCVQVLQFAISSHCADTDIKQRAQQVIINIKPMHRLKSAFLLLWCLFQALCVTKVCQHRNLWVSVALQWLLRLFNMKPFHVSEGQKKLNLQQERDPEMSGKSLNLSLYVCLYKYVVFSPFWPYRGNKILVTPVEHGLKIKGCDRHLKYQKYKDLNNNIYFIYYYNHSCIIGIILIYLNYLYYLQQNRNTCLVCRHCIIIYLFIEWYSIFKNRVHKVLWQTCTYSGY